MSLNEDALASARARLRSVKTVVTTASGRVFTEEKDGDGGTVSRPATDTRPGYVVDTRLDLDVAEILDYLFLGSQDPAQEPGLLDRYGITHVLSVGVDLPPFALSSRIRHLKVDLLDEPGACLADALNVSIGFIERARAENAANRVFVHCNAGYSRAPTVVVGYLMGKFGCSVSEALERVRARRQVKPNEGFMKQLEQFEREWKRDEVR